MNDKPRHLRKRRATSAADILDSTFRYLHLDKAAERYKGFQYWPQIVGDKIATVSKPEKIIRGNVLVVRVQDAVWSQELELKKVEILAKMQHYDMGSIIEDIRFIPGDPRAFNKANC